MQEPTNEPFSGPLPPTGKQCFNCGTTLASDATFCPRCGSPTPQCFNCGKELPAKATFCPHCGAPLPTQGSGISIALRIIGLIILAGFALLFGAAGACFMLFTGAGVLSGPGSSTPEYLGFGLIGLVLLGCAALCIWGAVALVKKR